MFCFVHIVASAGEPVSRNGTAAPPTTQVPASAVVISAAEADVFKNLTLFVYF